MSADDATLVADTLAPALQARLSPELRKLLALDDTLNDRLCSEVTGQSGFLR